MKKQRYIALALLLAVFMSCVPVTASAADVDMYSYNGVILPQLPSTNYMSFIYASSDGSTYSLYYKNVNKANYNYQIYASSSSSTYCSLSSYWECYNLSSAGTAWVTGDRMLSSALVYLNRVVWSNFDICVKNTSTVVFAGSEPVLVDDSETESTEPTEGLMSITVSASESELYWNDQVQFYSYAYGTGEYSSAVTWSLDSSVTDSGTTLSDTGLLTVGGAESNLYITVRATSVEDPTIYGTCTRRVYFQERGSDSTDETTDGSSGTDYSEQLNDIESSVAQIDTKVEAVSDAVEELPGQITDGMSDVLDQQQQEAQDQGQASVDEVIEIIPNQSEDFLAALQTLVSALNYEGTAASIKMDAITIPSVGGLFPEFVVLEPQEIDFEYWFNQMPSDIMALIRALFDIAVVGFCLKEFLGLLGEAVNGFANVNRELED